MALELKGTSLEFRVDGGDLECMLPGGVDLIQLDRLLVVIEKRSKDELAFCLLYQHDGANELPLYGGTRVFSAINRHTYLIDTGEEPAYREFFTQVAAECGRTVASLPSPEQAQARRRFWKHG